MEKSQLLGIGNPLLDITVNGDASLLAKYKLKPNDAIIAGESQKLMYQDLLENYKVQLSAGGSVQNSLRICQWILREPKVCVFMGSVGTDKYSQILQETAENDGVEVRYQYQPDFPTGTCASIITTHEGSQRSLCANLGAAEKFTIDHILKPDNYKFIEKAHIYYISGFFIPVSLETVLKIGEIAASQNKVLMINLSAPFICKLFKDSLLKVILYADIVFGNETEVSTFCGLSLSATCLQDMALQIANLPKENKKRERIIVVTNSSLPVLVARGNTVKEIKVPQISKDKILDTNGAGDAFVGGFLSQYLLGKSVEKCIDCGMWAANQIIQNNGCTFNKHLQYSE